MRPLLLAFALSFTGSLPSYAYSLKCLVIENDGTSKPSRLREFVANSIIYPGVKLGALGPYRRVDVVAVANEQDPERSILSFFATLPDGSSISGNARSFSIRNERTQTSVTVLCSIEN